MLHSLVYLKGDELLQPLKYTLENCSLLMIIQVLWCLPSCLIDIMCAASQVTIKSPNAVGHSECISCQGSVLLGASGFASMPKQLVVTCQSSHS